MALPSSGSISLSQVNTELGLSATAQISMNSSNVRTLFGKASGAISMADGRGKSNAFQFNPTISANTTNYNLKSAAIAAGWDQVQPLNATVTVNSGVYVGSTSTGSYGFDTGASFPAGTTLTLINNGFIVGMGGSGGRGGESNVNGDYLVYAGGSGGPALRAQAAISITNNGTIGGGGGGGGGGAIGIYQDYSNPEYTYFVSCPGGGGGGGRGLNSVSGGARGTQPHPSYTTTILGSDGGSGSSTSAGGGGAGGYNSGSQYGGSGGNGGGLGSSGGGGGSPASGSGFIYTYGGSAGGAGAAVAGNSNITWVATGTRLGAIA